jgi:hypothetical protein
MKLTRQWLKNKGACTDAYKWYLDQKTTDMDELFKRAMESKRYLDINWVIAHKLSRMDRVRYAIFAAELVIHIFEEKYPTDKRPANAILAAKNYLLNPSPKNRKLADAAADAAFSTYPVVYSSVADVAGYAAYAAADCAISGEYAYSAADAATYAAYAYTNPNDAREKIYVKILTFGFELLKGK